MFKKGDFVRVKATVRADYEKGYDDESVVYLVGKDVDDRNLFRHETDFIGIVIGKSYRETGKYVEADTRGEEWLPAYLSKAKRHPVWMVERLKSERYFKPIPCLEADLERVSPGD